MMLKVVCRGLKLLHCLELEAPRLICSAAEDVGMARLCNTLGHSQNLSPRNRPAAGFWAVMSFILPLSEQISVGLPINATDIHP